MSSTNRKGAKLMRGVALACLAMTIATAQNSAPKKAPPRKAVNAFQQGLKAAQARKTEDARVELAGMFGTFPGSAAFSGCIEATNAAMTSKPPKRPSPMTVCFCIGL